MTSEAMHARAVAELAEEFSRTHDQPEQDAQRFLARLARAGWRPVAALVDDPGPARRARSDVKDRIVADAKTALRTPHSPDCTWEMRARDEHAPGCPRCEILAAFGLSDRKAGRR